MVNTEKILTPSEYLEMVTGIDYIVLGDDDVEFIESVLAKRNKCLWNYPLTEIDHIVENKLNVVLVDCLIYENEDEYRHEYRWFEVEE